VRDMKSLVVPKQSDRFRAAIDRVGQAGAGRRVTLIGAGINIFLIALKFAAGTLGHSQALIADAVHSVSDLFTDAVVLLGLKVGRRAPDETHHFGHGRYETLASTVVGLALVGVAVYLGVESGLDIYHHIERHPTLFTLGAAFISIVLKEGLYRYTIHVGRRAKSTALVANAWHHRSDALSSVAVLLGLAGAQIRPEWHIFDAYAALAVSFLILKVGLDVVWSSLREFTDAAPKVEVLQKIANCARGVEGVIDLHDLKVRTSSGLYQMELHVVVDGDLSVTQGHKIAKKVEVCLMKELDDLGQVIVHVDPLGEEKNRER
jgi:cation diffusion facilitator family transporter